MGFKIWFLEFNNKKREWLAEKKFTKMAEKSGASWAYQVFMFYVLITFQHRGLEEKEDPKGSVTWGKIFVVSNYKDL